MTGSMEALLRPEERALWEALDSPARIQAFLDEVDYRGEETNRSVVRVLRDRQAHCLDGGIFAAAALRRLGHLPVIVDLLPEPGTDDDHVLALYRSHGSIGAVAKSNFAGLRFREPVYRSLRELVMSYFEAYFNAQGQKTLRFYTRPLNLATLDRHHWETEDAGVDAIEVLLPQLRRVTLLAPEQAAGLAPVDARSYQAGMLGTNLDGLYRPKG